MPNPAADFPTSIHSGTDVSGYGASKLGSTATTHTSLEGKQESELTAVQTKVGTGSSTPTDGKVLKGNGVGTSEWADLTAADVGAVDKTGDTMSGNLDISSNELRFGNVLYALLNTVSHGASVLVSKFTELSFVGGMSISSNSSIDGSGNWEPYFWMAADGTSGVLNTTQGAAGDKYFLVQTTDGLKIQTGTYKGGIKTTNLTADRALEIPDAAGTFVLNDNTATITNKDISGASNTYRSASDSVSGAVEIATAAEVNTGTDATRAVSPDALAGSNLGIRYMSFALNGSTALTTSDVAYARIPAGLTGMNLVSVSASVGTGAAGASSSGTPTFTVRNVTDSNQMLSTNLTVDANEYTSATAATPAVINTATDDVVTDDLIEVACTVAGTGVTYAVVTLGFQLP